MNVAAMHGQCDILRFLISKGALHHSQEFTRSPLNEAVKYLQYDAAVLLLNEGSHIDHRDHCGWTPLIYAANHGSWPFLHLLLSRGADPYVGDRDDDDDAEVFSRLEGHNDQAKFLAEVKALGGWGAYLHEPRRQMLSLRILCERGRATTRDFVHLRIWGPNTFIPPGITYAIFKGLSEGAREEVIALSRANFPSSQNKVPRTTRREQLPIEIFKKILSYWRSDRDDLPSRPAQVPLPRK